MRACSLAQVLARQEEQLDLEQLAPGLEAERIALHLGKTVDSGEESRLYECVRECTHARMYVCVCVVCVCVQLYICVCCVCVQR